MSYESDSDKLARLADSFVDRYQRGEHPSIEQYAGEHPELADQIREMFPALALMEQLSPSQDSSSWDGRRDSATIQECVGDYRILREVGRGGMGVVYEAEQQALQRRVALKVLPHLSSKQPHARRRFEQEARSAARLHHSNIVPVFDVGADGETMYYAMQFIPGMGLDEVLAELKRFKREQQTATAASLDSPELTAVSLAQALYSGERSVRHAGEEAGTKQGDKQPAAAGSTLVESASPAVTKGDASEVILPGRSDLSSAHSKHDAYFRSVAEIGVQVARALAYAHGEGILHRDIKPSNLLLDNRSNIWVTDFGLAKAEGTNLTQTGDIVGTVNYMAPERFTGWSDRRSDVYGLGITLYELLTLQSAFEASDRLQLINKVTNDEPLSPRSVDRSIPADLETIVVKAIAKEPQDRYQTATELADDLTSFLMFKPIKARRSSGYDRTKRWCRRNPALATLASSLFASLTAGLIVVSYLWASARTQRDIALVNKAEAEEMFQKASDILNNYYLKVESIKLDNLPGMQPLREDLLQEALEYFRYLASKKSNDLKLRSYIATAQWRIGDIEVEKADYSAAMAAYKKALEEFEALTAENPADAVNLGYLAGIHNNLGILQRKLGNEDAAYKAYARAIQIRKRLVDLQPDDRVSLYNLAKHYANISSLLRDLSRNKEAAQYADLHFEIASDLVKRMPEVHSYQATLAMGYLERALSRRELGDLEAARALLKESHRIRTQLVAAKPRNTNYRKELASSYFHLAKMATATGGDGVEAYLNAGIEILRKLVDENSSVISFRKELSRRYYSLAQYYEQQGQLDTAIRIAESSLDELSSALESSAGTSLRREMSSATYQLSTFYDSKKELHTRLKYLRRSIDHLHELRKANSHDRTVRYQIGLLCGELARGEAKAGQLELAAAAFDEAIAHLCFDNHPARYQSNAIAQRARAHYGKAKVLFRQGQLAEGRAQLATALEFAKPPNLLKYRLNCAKQLALADHYADAIEIAEQIPDQEDFGGLAAVDTAIVFARSATLVAEDDSLGDSRRQELSQQYANRSIEILCHIEDSGFAFSPSVVKYLRTSQHLRAIESDSRFIDFLARLEPQ